MIPRRPGISKRGHRSARPRITGGPTRLGEFVFSGGPHPREEPVPTAPKRAEVIIRVRPRHGVRHVSGSFAPGLHDRSDRFGPHRQPADHLLDGRRRVGERPRGAVAQRRPMPRSSATCCGRCATGRRSIRRFKLLISLPSRFVLKSPGLRAIWVRVPAPAPRLYTARRGESVRRGYLPQAAFWRPMRMITGRRILLS